MDVMTIILLTTIGLVVLSLLFKRLYGLEISRSSSFSVSATGSQLKALQTQIDMLAKQLEASIVNKEYAEEEDEEEDEEEEPTLRDLQPSPKVLLDANIGKGFFLDGDYNIVSTLTQSPCKYGRTTPEGAEYYMGVWSDAGLITVSLHELEIRAVRQEDQLLSWYIRKGKPWRVEIQNFDLLGLYDKLARKGVEHLFKSILNKAGIHVTTQK